MFAAHSNISFVRSNELDKQLQIFLSNAPTSTAACHGRRAFNMPGAPEHFLPMSSHQCTRSRSPLRAGKGEELCIVLLRTSENEVLFRVY
ncbi:hypothetical protein KFK09_028544 [Dendrobium nobile]|uniref:Uncharacterized protein n=1 Tax=Dendrobium nobile TaxID=94219 RepID=A0A8T3A1V3_DENNO|nr:hypothetical protein KFK09_028544 [Dendrobium nobile]